MSGPLVQALEKRRQEDLAKTQPLTPGTLEWAWAQAQKPFKGYWDRQGLMAREGLAMADQGAQQVRQGDLSGLAGMVLGPANYLSSPINALFPIEEAQTQLPKSVSPFVAGGLELMALAAPGPKGGRLSKVADAAEEGITAYHGSPHTFDKFDMSKIGTGEGAQAYGHGLYFAENEGVAKAYRDQLTPRVAGVPDELSAAFGKNDVILSPGRTDGLRNQRYSAPEQFIADLARHPDIINDPGVTPKLREAMKNYTSPGSMYQVRLNVKPDELLDWDRPLSEQPESVRAALSQFGIASRGGELRDGMPLAMNSSGQTKLRIVNDGGRKQYFMETPDGIRSKLYNSDIEALVGKPGEDVLGQAAFTQVGAKVGDKAAAAAKLKAAGIKGIRYKDAGSRDKDGGTYNYVIFDDKLVDILKRYAIPFTLGAGGAVIVSGQDMPPEVASQLGPQA